MVDIQDCYLYQGIAAEFDDVTWCSLVLVINSQPVNALLIDLNRTWVLAK
jgi:hypothetical protein